MNMQPQDYESMQEKQNPHPVISIIIRAFNEAKHLNFLIQSIKKQNISSVEIILVDSGSVDGTKEIGFQHADQVIEIDPHDFTFGYSLNVGIRRGRGKYIVIVSAHTYPLGSEWLSNLMKPMNDPKVAMVYGRQFGDSDSKISELRDFSQYYPEQSRIQHGSEYYANNANSLIRRDLWDHHQFDENLTGLEDQEWSRYWMNKGYVVAYTADASIIHIHDESDLQVCNRYYRETVAALQIGLKQRLKSYQLLWMGLKDLMRDIFYLFQKENVCSDKVSECYRFRLNQYRGIIKANQGHFNYQKEHMSLFYPGKNMSVVIKGKNSVVLEDAPIPEIKPNDVLIRVHYVGVCGTDLEVLEGNLGYYQSGWAQYPIVPGHEFSGEVVRFGARVPPDRFKLHDLVVGECILGCQRCEECQRENPIGCAQRREVGVLNFNGAYAQYVVLPSYAVHVLPYGADLASYCFVEPLAVALKGVSRLLAMGSDCPRTIGIIGAGPIGYLVSQVFSFYGHDVTVIDKQVERLKHIPQTIGTRQDLKDLGSFSVLVEASGNLEVLNAVLNNSRTGAHILLLGFPYGNMVHNFESVVAFDRTIVGSVGSNSQNFKEAIRLIPKLNLEPLQKNILPATDYRQAWNSQRSGSTLKTLLSWEI